MLTALRLTLWTVLTALWPIYSMLMGGLAVLTFLGGLLFGGIWLFAPNPAPFVGEAALYVLPVSLVASVLNIAYGALVFALEPKDRVTFYQN
ncbi:hypothetical protein [Bradyrhizobium australafricanum]|uniref:hypothetical protein n=1 Tax=Bradyrhizobium australafricanum TaxID=2821406 RepID=UPI001CE29357|nr:hypothetical protein [Bradyrhizobium australafricanum]MCA6105373.1 hypothetical protein [Bradyrhizobium australafricanum]